MHQVELLDVEEMEDRADMGKIVASTNEARAKKVHAEEAGNPVKR